jgi:uncharacterized protein (DUF924 family)
MYQAVLHFWFVEVSPAQRWKADPSFDQRIAERFGALHKKAVLAELYHWRRDAKGRLDLPPSAIPIKSGSPS